MAGACKERVALLLIVAALAVSIIALVLERWVVMADQPAGTDVTSTLTIGVKTLTLTTTRSGTVVDVKTSTLPDEIETNYVLGKGAQAFIEKLNSGGTAVINCGAIAGAGALVAVILTCIGISGRRAPLKVAGTIIVVLAGSIIVVGVVVYSRSLDVGWSFIVSIFASFSIFAGAISLGAGLVGKAPSRTQKSFSLLLLIVGVVLMVTAMSSKAWWQSVTDAEEGGVKGTYTRSFGLKTWERVAEFGANKRVTSGSLSDTEGLAPAQAALYKRLDDAGTNVIITGTVCMVLALVSFALSWLYIFKGPRPGRYLFFGVIMGLLSGAVCMLGTLLYADTLYVGWSFFIFTASSFLYFAAMAVMVASFGADDAAHGYVQHRGDISPTSEPASLEGGYAPPPI